MKTSSKGLKAIIDFEGFRENAYQDVVGIWTIGYGFIKGVSKGDKMTREQADRRLIAELKSYEEAVWIATGGNATQNQFDALVSFTWNVGKAGMAKSTVIKAHDRGDHQSAARAFGLWNKAGGKVWPGLTRRRAAEAAAYLEIEPGEAVQEMPQGVDPETKMGTSQINIGSTVAAGSAGLVAVTQSVSSMTAFKTSIEGLGTWLLPVLCLVIIAAAGFVIWQRIQQRKGGWA